MAFLCVQCFSQKCVQNTAETSNNVFRSSTHHGALHSRMRGRFDEKVHWTRCSSSAGCAVVLEGRGTADAKPELTYCSKTNQILWMRRSVVRDSLYVVWTMCKSLWTAICHTCALNIVTSVSDMESDLSSLARVLISTEQKEGSSLILNC